MAMQASRLPVPHPFALSLSKGKRISAPRRGSHDQEALSLRRG